MAADADVGAAQGAATRMEAVAAEAGGVVPTGRQALMMGRLDPATVSTAGQVDAPTDRLRGAIVPGCVMPLSMVYGRLACQMYTAVATPEQTSSVVSIATMLPIM